MHSAAQTGHRRGWSRRLAAVPALGQRGQWWVSIASSEPVHTPAEPAPKAKAPYRQASVSTWAGLPARARANVPSWNRLPLGLAGSDLAVISTNVRSWGVGS